MNRSTSEPEDEKQQLISAFILPLIGECLGDPALILSKISNSCQLHHVLKSQQLESPGRHEEGAVWFSIQAMAHSYCYNTVRNISLGTRIWKRREFMFNQLSLFKGDYRDEYIEMLEPGEVLSIPYGKLRQLMEEIPEMEAYIQSLHLTAEHYFKRQYILVNDPPLQRVKKFEAENPLFCSVASNTIKAMHVCLSRQGYELQLKQLKQGK